MASASIVAPQSTNLNATSILDIESPEVQNLARSLAHPEQPERILLQRAHQQLSEMIRPIYTVDEWQPASNTLQKKRGSCSQRMACLEAVARACGVPTRGRALFVMGRFRYPRFPVSRWFIPHRILLVWPQFYISQAWTDFDELFASTAELAAETPGGFRNDGETLFEAVRKTPVDFLGKTCGLSCSKPEQDLSKFVIQDLGFFDTRDEVFRRFGSFQHTLRGRAFEFIYGGRKSA